MCILFSFQGYKTDESGYFARKNAIFRRAAGGGISVSVIIPVYNAAPYLNETLNSIVTQTLKQIEIICINDGSTDTSLEILEQWVEKDERIRIISQLNFGQGCARNVGVSYARGKYLYFMDSDDLLEQDALEQLVAVMEEKVLDVLFFDGTTFFDNEALAETFSNFRSTYMRNRAYDDIYDGPTLLCKFCEENKYTVSPCLQMLRTEFVQKNDIAFLPGIIYEDNPFTFEVLLKAKRVSHLQRTYFHRRIREGSTMTKDVTFYNVYSYYRCFHAMLHTYYKVAPKLTQESCNVALGRVAAILRSTQYDYAKLPPESKGSELGLRENLLAFQILVYNNAQERSKARELNAKLQQTYAEKSEINRKLQITYGEKFDRGVQIKELKKQIEALKAENTALKSKSPIKKLYIRCKPVLRRVKHGLVWLARKIKLLPAKQE